MEFSRFEGQGADPTYESLLPRVSREEVSLESRVIGDWTSSAPGRLGCLRLRLARTQGLRASSPVLFSGS
ncbi:MAG: hypothetical protein EA421_17580 [Gemmatimonadales bacterium]|nr:MAG: hypothetical protein EA421_17580 [Gemmatimonadales bacterium]